MEEGIVNYTIDVDSMDKVIPSDLFKNQLIDYQYLTELINPFDIKVLFGRKQEKIMVYSDGIKSFYILNPYINKDFKNVHYFDLKSCVFPRYYNVYEEDGVLKKEDIYNERFIYLFVDINQNTTIYSTNQNLNNNKYIKLKVLHNNIYDKFVLLQPINTNHQFYFKNGQLKNIDTLKLKFYDDEMKPIVLNFSHLWNPENVGELSDYIKNHSVNLQFTVGCYEINMRNTNDY